MATLLFAAGLIAGAQPSEAPDRALERVDAALAKRPDDAALHIAKGQILWDNLRHAKSAIAAAERAVALARDPRLEAEARYLLARIYMFRGWHQEGAFPGWHAEPEFRDRAVIELNAALARDPGFADAARLLADAQKYAEAGVDVKAAPSAADRTIAELDARVEAVRNDPAASADAVLTAVEARIAARHDPAAYLSGANLLILRRQHIDRAIAIAKAAVPAAERFVEENAGAYKMADKARGTVTRTRASAADVVGWAGFVRGDAAAASAALEESERLSRGQDLVNQFHLGELARRRGQLDRARDHYLNALTLTGPEPVKAEVRKALADVHVKLGNDAAGFEKWIAGELDRRREARREGLVRSMVDRPAPALKVTDVQGRAFDLASLRGKVLLLNFFASW